MAAGLHAVAREVQEGGGARLDLRLEGAHGGVGAGLAEILADLDVEADRSKGGADPLRSLDDALQGRVAVGIGPVADDQRDARALAAGRRCRSLGRAEAEHSRRRDRQTPDARSGDDAACPHHAANTTPTAHRSSIFRLDSQRLLLAAMHPLQQAPDAYIRLHCAADSGAGSVPPRRSGFRDAGRTDASPSCRLSSRERRSACRRRSRSRPSAPATARRRARGRPSAASRAPRPCRRGRAPAR